MKHRKTTKLTKVLITASLWLLLATLIYFLPPKSTPTFIAFFTLLTLALLQTLTLILNNRRQSILTTLAIITWLILRALGLGTPLNAILIATLVATIELAIKYH
jgi:hypothetical protein